MRCLCWDVRYWLTPICEASTATGHCPSGPWWPSSYGDRAPGRRALHFRGFLCGDPQAGRSQACQGPSEDQVRCDSKITMPPYHSMSHLRNMSSSLPEEARQTAGGWGGEKCRPEAPALSRQGWAAELEAGTRALSPKDGREWTRDRVPGAGKKDGPTPSCAVHQRPGGRRSPNWSVCASHTESSQDQSKQQLQRRPKCRHALRSLPREAVPQLRQQDAVTLTCPENRESHAHTCCSHFQPISRAQPW